ncbi:MAG: NAD-dependent epimerase/dehydratase family protein [Thermoguttaceae bacterium]|jgi:nucleoside-diphosphate-sugar epimerase
MTRLIVGCGYLGRRVALRWQAAGHEVLGLVRDPAQAAELARQAIRPILADVTRPETSPPLPQAETVLYAVGYHRGGGQSRWDVCVEGLRAVLAALPSGTGRIIFISSTSVLGESAGDWVDEDSPCRPQREAGQALLAAETLLLAHPLGRRAVILRLAGLYGPGRLPRTTEIVAGKVLAVSPNSQANLIHVDDAAAVVLAAEMRAQPPCTYLVSDGHPVDRRTFCRYLAELLGAPPPQFCEPAPEAADRHRSEKRVSSARMSAQLGVALQYPSYREGLAASLNLKSEI